MLDLFWSPRLAADNYREYIEFDEGRASNGRRDGGRTATPALSARFTTATSSGSASRAAGSVIPAAITTQEFKNPLLDVFFQKLRERSGHTMVPRQGAVLKLFNMLRKRGRVALLVDTTLPPHHPTIVIDCFGLKTIITVAHAWLQERSAVADAAALVRAARRRAVSRDHASAGPATGGRHASRDRAGVLGCIRADGAAESGAMALDVQALALQTDASAASVTRSTRKSRRRSSRSPRATITRRSIAARCRRAPSRRCHSADPPRHDASGSNIDTALPFTLFHRRNYAPSFPPSPCRRVAAAGFLTSCETAPTASRWRPLSRDRKTAATIRTT